MSLYSYFTLSLTYLCKGIKQLESFIHPLTFTLCISIFISKLIYVIVIQNYVKQMEAKMYQYVQPFVRDKQIETYEQQYLNVRSCLFNLLDSPVKSTTHIGGTKHFNYPTEPILDILVGVDNLHDITALDEKRLNYEGFYRLHHKYHKKVVMAQFNNLIDLKQQVRLHIIQNNTELFEQYQQIDALLSHHAEAIALFSQYKQSLSKASTTIREYETNKATIFTKLRQFLS